MRWGQTYYLTANHMLKMTPAKVAISLVCFCLCLLTIIFITLLFPWIF